MIQCYPQQQWHTDQFWWYYLRWGCSCFPKHSSTLWIEAKFNLAFIYALILLLRSFLLLARLSVVCDKKWLHSVLIPPKHESTSGVNNPCSTWRIHWLYSHFVLLSFFLWTAGRLWCKWRLANGLKTLTSSKVYPLIHNPLADTSALACLLVFTRVKDLILLLLSLLLLLLLLLSLLLL